ncbi:MAG: hypothetical protein HOV79_34385 [Hamadaea sp.]|nr:hypothetical protein [Hamadaea sp.]
MRSPSVPLRPLTVGELLDASVEVTRSAGRAVLPLALLLAALEQVIMVWLREGFFRGSIFPDVSDLIGPAWFAVAVGAGTEIAIIAILGVPASRAAAAGVAGTAPRARDLLRPGAFVGAAFIALVAGVTAFTVTLLPLGWFVAYPLFGLAVAAAVIDRRNPVLALGRGVAMGLRGGGRAAGVRILGYISFLLVRLAFGFGLIAALGFFGIDAGPWGQAACFAIVNTVAYATLAGLDAVLHLEARIRTEGLDIALGRSPGPLTPADLAVTR